MASAYGWHPHCCVLGPSRELWKLKVMPGAFVFSTGSQHRSELPLAQCGCQGIETSNLGNF